MCCSAAEDKDTCVCVCVCVCVCPILSEMEYTFCPHFAGLIGNSLKFYVCSKMGYRFLNFGRKLSKDNWIFGSEMPWGPVRVLRLELRTPPKI